MDPNANLEELLALAKQEQEDHLLDEDDITRMAELVLALDGWLRSGGFLPARWDVPELNRKRGGK